VLPGLRELFLQYFRPEHYIVVSLEHVRFSVGISPRHPAADNSCYLGTQHLWQIDYSRVPTTYLHPLLGLAHRLQMTHYHRQVDEMSTKSAIPPRLLVAAPDIGAEWISSAS
jgi:hypothetical protein